MSMAMNEITLVLFTTIAPAGIIGYIVMCAFALFSSKENCRTASHYLVIPLVLVISGLIASATHLGTPANALYVLKGINRSPLSNEVVAVVVFLAIGGLYWIASFRDDWNEALRRAIILVSMAAGCAALWMMSIAYSVEWIPTWNLPTVPFTMLFGGIAAGVVVGMFGLMVARVPVSPRLTWALVGIGAIAALACGVSLAQQWVELGAIVTTVTTASELVPWLPYLSVLFPAVVIVCHIIAGVSATRKRLASNLKARATIVGSCCFVALLACFVVRFTFYAMHMTAGV